MKEVCIGLGSNLGNSLHILQNAWAGLNRHKKVRPVALSSPYRSEPIGMESPNWFINAAGHIRTALEPRELLGVLLDIERQFDRRRQIEQPSYQDRTLDLDLLFYDNLIINEPGLRVPHPQAHRRLFVLIPLEEIVPVYIHPLYKQTIQELCSDLKQNRPLPVVEKMSWHGWRHSTIHAGLSENS